MREGQDILVQLSGQIKKNQDAGRKAQDILDSKTGRKAQNKGARFLNR